MELEPDAACRSSVRPKLIAVDGSEPQAELFEAGKIGVVDDELVRVRPAVRTNGDRFAAPDQGLGAAESEVFPSGGASDPKVCRRVRRPILPSGGWRTDCRPCPRASGRDGPRGRSAPDSTVSSNRRSMPEPLLGVSETLGGFQTGDAARFHFLKPLETGTHLRAGCALIVPCDQGGDQTRPIARSRSVSEIQALRRAALLTMEETTRRFLIHRVVSSRFLLCSSVFAC